MSLRISGGMVDAATSHARGLEARRHGRVLARLVQKKANVGVLLTRLVGAIGRFDLQLLGLLSALLCLGFRPCLFGWVPGSFRH